MIKKLLASALVIILTAFAVSSCGGGAPELSSVKDELVGLIEASYEINDVFFGEGLPTYERGGDYDKEYRLYDDVSAEFDYYEYVTEDAAYHFVDQIKSAAEKVYTTEYLRGIYTMAFDGYADENTGKVTTSRYLEADSWLLKYAFGEEDSFNILPGKRVYDFDSMEIVKPSSAKYLNVEIDSEIVGEADSALRITLRFKLTDNGWRLDSPTY
jgi:hypothetical protein